MVCFAVSTNECFLMSVAAAFPSQCFFPAVNTLQTLGDLQAARASFHLELPGMLSFAVVESLSSTSLAWAGAAFLVVFVAGGMLCYRLLNVRRQLDEVRKVVAEQTSDLQASREKYRWLIDGLHENYVFFTTTQDGLIRHVSPSVKNVLGYEADEVINKTWQSLTASQNSLDDTLKDALKRKTALVVETSVRCKDGTSRWLELTQFPLKDPSDANEARECIAKDVTQLRQTEESLTAARDELDRRVAERTTVLQDVNERLSREIQEHQATSRRLNQSELQYRTIVEDQTEMVIRFQADGTLLFANRAYRQRHQLTPESIGTFNVFSVIHPNDRAAAMQRVAAITSSEPIRIPLMKTVDKHGKTDWADWSGRALFDEDGSLLGYQGAGRIITDLVEAQQKLAESELQYRSIVEDQTEMILRFDATGRITFANAASAAANSMMPEEAVGRLYYARVHAEDRTKVRQMVSSATLQDPVRQFETRCYRPDDTLTHEAWTCRALFNSTGTLREYQAVGRDITELWEAQRRLDEKEQQLAHLARISALGEMVAGISHEINQPLATITNFASASRLLLNQPTLGETEFETLRTWSEKTTQQTAKINAIIQRLRRFSRPGSTLERFKIKEAITEALLVTETRTRHTIDQIDVDCPSTIPLVTADRIQVEQVLVNMIRNACDAMENLETGKRKLQILVAAADDDVVVTILDSGPGLSSDLATGVFDAFVTTKSDGMGVGLAISRSIIESHGGRIKATADATGGRFEFSLPINQQIEHE